MTKLLTLAAIFVFSLSAFAQNNCLKNASNQDIVKELSSRLKTGSSSSSDNQVIVSFSVSSGSLKVTLTDLNTGKEIRDERWLGSTADILAKLLNEKIAGRVLSESKMFAYCTSGNLNRILLNVTKFAVQNLETEWVGSQCQGLADAINNNL